MNSKELLVEEGKYSLWHIPSREEFRVVYGYNAGADSWLYGDCFSYCEGSGRGRFEALLDAIDIFDDLTGGKE